MFKVGEKVVMSEIGRNYFYKTWGELNNFWGVVEEIDNSRIIPVRVRWINGATQRLRCQELSLFEPEEPFDVERYL